MLVVPTIRKGAEQMWDIQDGTTKIDWGVRTKLFELNAAFPRLEGPAVYEGPLANVVRHYMGL
jgi:hypothetical protein